jgi:hypothetical protein
MESRWESRYEYANSWLHTPAVSWTDWLRRAGLPYFRLLIVSPISIVDKKKMKVLSQRDKPWRYQMEKSVKISGSTMIL